MSSFFCFALNQSNLKTQPILFELIIAGKSEEIGKIELQWSWVVFSFGLYLFNLIFSAGYLINKKQDKSRELIEVWIIPVVFILMIIFGKSVIPENEVASRVLNKLGYIEYNKEKSWYLLDKRFLIGMCRKVEILLD